MADPLSSCRPFTRQGGLFFLPAAALGRLAQTCRRFGERRGGAQFFEQPAGLNVYLTGDRVEKAAPPHTDRQEVFVVQCAGAKRWRVFASASA